LARQRRDEQLPFVGREGFDLLEDGLKLNDTDILF
jgi:hypothetical protein